MRDILSYSAVNQASLRWLTAATLLVGAILASPLSAAAESAPFCDAGQAPHFAFGVADLKAAVGAAMGDPMECEHPNSANGDTLQQTTTGLAIYRQSTNTPEFTDGWNHWALSVDGLEVWSGASDQVAGAPGPWGAAPTSAAPRSSQSPAAGSTAQAPSQSKDAPAPTQPNDAPAPSQPKDAPAQTQPRQAPAANQPSTARTQCVDLGGGSCLNTEAGLADTVGILSHSPTGAPLLRTAAGARYMVHYGDLPVDVLGLFRPARHEVVVSNTLKPFPAVDRVPVLAHELQHVTDWITQGMTIETMRGCLGTEANAFHTESTVWQEVAGSRLKSPSNDLEREFNLISQAINTDPQGFIDRLNVVYHDECVANSTGSG